MPKIKVYPLHENAFVLRHPVDGPISDKGSMWEDDAFTGKMINEHEISADPDRAHKFKRQRPDHSQPPAHATGAGVTAKSATQLEMNTEPAKS